MGLEGACDLLQSDEGEKETFDRAVPEHAQQSDRVVPHHLTFTGLSATEEATHLLVRAGIDVADAGRPAGALDPGQRIYPGSPSPFASVAVRYGVARDLYVILGAFDPEGRWATIKAQIHPMIAWIWLGGAVVVLGGVVVLWPRRRPAPAAVPAAERVAIAGASDPRP